MITIFILIVLAFYVKHIGNEIDKDFDEFDNK
jgi:hypothetical protein